MIRDLQGQIVAFQPLDMLQLDVFVAEVCVCVCMCVLTEADAAVQ